MFNTGFYLNDLSMHDSSRDLVLVGTQQTAELKLAIDQEKQKSSSLVEVMDKLEIEVKKNNEILCQMMPKRIVERIGDGEPLGKLSETFPSATILFSDIVGFTNTINEVQPFQVVMILNDMYTRYDKSMENRNIYKLDTVINSFMVASGLEPKATSTHANDMIELAIEMMRSVASLRNPANGQPILVKIGI
jgi:guanylate cyclase